MLIKKTFDITGIVQGVGFRPSVARLAREVGLGGWIQNRSGVVRLCLEGEEGAVEKFIKDLPEKLPVHARIESIVMVGFVGAQNFVPLHPEFHIIDSAADEQTNVVIPADLVMCPDCLREIFDSNDRRYGYPFTTCTNCGPRYTVVNDMPYDRERTTLNQFPLCPDCFKEYTDETNRRYHAESTACPTCGPTIFLTPPTPSYQEGAFLKGTPSYQEGAGGVLREVREAIAEGKIIAVRGIGGFHLVVDAFNVDALKKLRERKHRPHKPFAVMVRNIAVAKRFCVVSVEEEKMLKSPEGPIVVLDCIPSPRTAVPRCRPSPQGGEGHHLPLHLLTPDADTLGVMLPTTPLHALLFEPLRDDPTPAFEMLVMTSGNRGGEPICTTNEEALDRLEGIADLFLLHDREINLRNDDSLCIMQQGQPQIWRRARGYAPNAIFLKKTLSRTVLAMGAELKNTIALGHNDRVVLSPHVGDLEAPEAVDGLRQVVDCFPKFLKREPEVIAVDLHPDMHATIIGQEIARQRSIPIVEVQHHHAHAVSCLAEHGFDEGLALVFDGTGLGPDGNIWGAELLDVTATGYKRLATFKPVPLLGGDAAVSNPARQLVARFFDANVDVSKYWSDRLRLSEEQLSILRTQYDRRINAPLTHAAGRLFDAFSVLTGIAADHVTYEGQTAIRVEAWAKRSQTSPRVALPFKKIKTENLFMIDWAPLFGQLAENQVDENERSPLALSFHYAVAEAALSMVEHALQKTSQRRIALSGGVFMNRILNDLIVPTLTAMGLKTLIHRKVPPNDGGIALGQAVVAVGNVKREA